MLNSNDTICAIATGVGGGIAIVRISGEKAAETLRRCFFPAARKKTAFEHGRMMYGFVKDANGETLDEAMAVCFYAPNSYTREDVCEIQLHGGRMCAAGAMEILLKLGVRAAQPGEFTRRAFLNGRIDLSAAEAVMGLVNAKSSAARRASVRQLKGGVSARVGRAREELLSLIALISAATDFPDEIDEDVTGAEVLRRARTVHAFLCGVSDRRQARIVRDGASVVLCGQPNVGKSSIMNAILSAERAIVTDIPGTTRDVLTERVEIGGVTVSLSDTAGLRDTEDAVEKIGVERAREALENADCVLAVMDAARGIGPGDRALIDKADERYIVVFNKCDLSEAAACPDFAVPVSAITGEGIDVLTEKILEKVRVSEADEDMMTLPRHIECAERAKEAILRAMDGIKGGIPLDFAAGDLREALEALGDITGETMNESVIDRVFSDFCVGK